MLSALPARDAVHTDYGPRGITVVGINLGGNPNVARDFVARTGVRYPIWLDAVPESAASDTCRALYAKFGGVGLPTTFIIDRDSVIRASHVGELNRALLQNQAEALLAR